MKKTVLGTLLGTVIMLLSSCTQDENTTIKNGHEVKITNNTSTYAAEFKAFQTAYFYVAKQQPQWEIKKFLSHLENPARDFLVSIGYTDQELHNMALEQLVELAFHKYADLIINQQNL